MKKMLCSLLTVLLLVSCFAGTVNAAERAKGSEMISFPATFVAGNDIIIMGNIKVLK